MRSLTLTYSGPLLELDMSRHIRQDNDAGRHVLAGFANPDALDKGLP